MRKGGCVTTLELNTVLAPLPTFQRHSLLAITYICVIGSSLLSERTQIPFSPMDINPHFEVLDQIVNPSGEDASKILGRLQLATTPTASEVHEDIEKRLLLPPKTFPAQWLHSYQVCDVLSLQYQEPLTVHFSPDTGSTLSLFHTC